MVSNPFENNVEAFDLKGEHIMEMLEFSVANDPWPGARMLQFGGNDFHESSRIEKKNSSFLPILSLTLFCKIRPSLDFPMPNK